MDPLRRLRWGALVVAGPFGSYLLIAKGSDAEAAPEPEESASAEKPRVFTSRGDHHHHHHHHGRSWGVPH